MDFNRIALLLHVVETTRHQPKLKAIHDAALTELEDHASGKVKEPDHSGAKFVDVDPKPDSVRRM
jgi:hypothetical protein